MLNILRPKDNCLFYAYAKCIRKSLVINTDVDRKTLLQEPMHSCLHMKTDFCLIQNTFLVTLMSITYC